MIELLDKLDDQDQRDWYAAKDAHHGWSRSLLQHHIVTRLHEREAAAPSNFVTTLHDSDADAAQEITKDPYALDFLAVDSNTTERELEQRMIDRIIDTMQELGPGLAFYGRQVHFDVDGDDFYVDLLFFHVEHCGTSSSNSKSPNSSPATPASSASTSLSSMSNFDSRTSINPRSGSCSSQRKMTPSCDTRSPEQLSR